MLSYLRDFINDKCIQRVPPGSKELPSIVRGSYYTWQFYLRAACLDPACLRGITDVFWSKFSKLFVEQPFQIAGVEAAATPIITAIILTGHAKGYLINGFTIRKEPKAYGLRQLIEGRVLELPVLFVDDLTSPQHKAFWQFIFGISQRGLSLNGHGFVLVRKMRDEDSNILHTFLGSVKVESIFTLDDFTLGYADYQASNKRISNVG
jgi:orotate phosphoribosyltransferase